jgi:hypothetical protein
MNYQRFQFSDTTGSFDLENWSPDGIQAVPGGFTVPITNQSFFLRIRVELTP